MDRQLQALSMAVSTCILIMLSQNKLSHPNDKPTVRTPAQFHGSTKFPDFLIFLHFSYNEVISGNHGGYGRCKDAKNHEEGLEPN